VPGSVVPRAKTTIISEQPAPKLDEVPTRIVVARLCSPVVRVLPMSWTAMLAGNMLLTALMRLLIIVDVAERGGVVVSGMTAADMREGRRATTPTSCVDGLMLAAVLSKWR
jgi:hypothetical protein